MAVNIGKLGTIVALFTVLVLLLRFAIEDFAIDGRKWNKSDDWSKILEFFIIGITVLVVAVPEGFFGVTFGHFVFFVNLFFFLSPLIKVYRLPWPFRWRIR